MGSWLPWRKLASNPPGLDWPALPWQSRGLYALMLGLADDAGVIRLGKLGLQSLAGALRASWPEIEPHFDALVMTGWAEAQEGQVKLPHFEDSQRAATTAERVAQYRERARNEPPAQRDVSPGQGSLAETAPSAAAKPKTARTAKPREQTAGSVIFAAYRESFWNRYGVEPPRDSRTNRHFANVAKNALVGRSASCSEMDAIGEACAVAARYVRHPDALYAKQQHPPGLLERDWHKLVTEYRTGRTVTATTARDHERTASNPILEYAAEIREQEEAAKRRKAEVIDVVE